MRGKNLKRSKHREKEFNSHLEYQRHCSDKAKYLIEFASMYDPMYVDEEGEVLGFKTPERKEIDNVWIGCFISIDNLLEDNYIWMWNQKKEKHEVVASMLIDKVTTKKILV